MLNEIAPLLAGSLLDISGLELPSVAGFSFEEPTVAVGDRMVEMSANLTFTP